MASAPPAPPPQRSYPPKIAQQYPVYSWRVLHPRCRLVYLWDIAAVEHELSVPFYGHVGFDLEWRPNYVKGQQENPVAVVQLAGADRILLIQVSAMRRFPDKLREFLEDPSVVKAGVAILNDCKKLWADWGVSVSNCVELGLLARTVDNPRWKGKYTQSIGLSRLCETYFGLMLPKGKIQRSNWEADLSAAQQDYAANDCHSGWMLYTHLSAMIPALDITPLPSFYTFDMMQGFPLQPDSPLVPLSQRVMWQAHNPFYDPGPPPENPKKEEGSAAGNSSESQTGGSTSGSQARFVSKGESHRRHRDTNQSENTERPLNRGGPRGRGRGFRPRDRRPA